MAKVRFKVDKSRQKTQKLFEKLSLDDKNERKRQDSECTDDASTAETAETRFSRFTNCTNPTFNKVHRLWKGGSDLQNDVLAVLAAVAETIKEQGGQETEVEYFAALFGSLSLKSSAEQEPAGLNTLSATVYLLSLVIRKVPYAVLMKSFEQTSLMLYNFLVEHSESAEANPLIRYSLDCLGVILKAQPHQIWNTPVTCKLFDTILHYTLDGRPRIRKAAQKAVANLLVHDSDTKLHPAAKACSKFLVDTIDKCGADSKQVATTCHALSLLGRTMPNMNASCFESCAETIFRLCDACSLPVWRDAISCLRAALADCPPRASCLPPNFNQRLIAMLYDFAPAVTGDWRARCVWTQAQLEAHRRLADSNRSLAAAASPTLLQAALEQLAAGTEKQSIFVTVNVIQQILSECLGEEIKNNTELCSNVASILKGLLSLKFVTLWPQCFDIITSFFKLCQPENNDVKDLLQAMGELRESENFTHSVPLEKCLGMAVRSLGPETVLNAIPLHINALTVTASSPFPNSWLLPLLRKNVRGAPLRHFVAIFLPLAASIQRRLDSDAAMSVGDRKFLTVLQQQIWELLPSYCHNPIDLVTQFPNVAKILGTILSEAPTLRFKVLACLRNLILTCDTVEGKAVMQRYAPNFLLILFNLYVVGEDEAQRRPANGYDAKGVRFACLETIKVYLTVTPVERFAAYLETALNKLDDCKLTADKKHRVMDVLVALAPHLQADELVKLFSAIGHYCNQTKDKSLQKKSYRVLEVAFNASSDASVQFFKQNQTDIMQCLELSINKSSPSTKGSRIRCLTKLLENNFLSIEVALKIMSDVVLCLKELNVRTRRSAAIFFIAVCNAIASERKNVQSAADEVWEVLQPMLEVELRNNDNYKSTCCALICARLFVFEFKNDCPAAVSGRFLSHALRLLISAQNRQIVQSCLEFLKTFIACSSQVTLGQFLDEFLPKLFKQTDDCQHHFRFLTRKILAKLLRKIPYELVKKHVPEQFQKQLNNVRKALQSYERKKTLNIEKSAEVEDDVISGVTGLSKPETIADLLRDTSDEEESESEPSYDDKNRSETKSRRSKRWQNANSVVLEQGDDEIFDFLDRKSMSMIKTRTIKSKKTSANDNHGFQVDDKGRLIITNDEEAWQEEEDEEFVALGKRKKTPADSAVAAAAEDDRPMKRRKTTTKSLVNDDNDGDSDLDEALHYRPGGKGIHRDTAAKADSGRKFRSKKAKGDVCKGQTQPYAYVPLDFKQLNKRKRAKSAGTFKNLVHGARKGANKGAKGRRKLKRL